jgi:hypothetical protein
MRRTILIYSHGASHKRVTETAEGLTRDMTTPGPTLADRPQPAHPNNGH